MRLNEYCYRLGWDVPKLARAAAIDVRTARKAIDGQAVTPRVARAIAAALTEELKQRVLPGEIEGLLERGE